MLIGVEGHTEAGALEATKIVFMLWEAYPGHPWHVRVYDGGFFIRHMDFPKNYGMNCKFKSVGHDAAVLKREIIRNAGEWLERAGLPRKRYEEGQETTYVEGVPDKDQIPRPLDDVKLMMPNGVEMNVSKEIRDLPRPQVMNS